MKTTAVLSGFVSLLLAACSPVDPQSVDQSKVALEVLAFNLAPGTDEAAVAAADSQTEAFVRMQPGFLRRVTGFGRHEPQSAAEPATRQFYVTVYWDSLQSATDAANAFSSSSASQMMRPGTTIAHYGHYVIGDSAAAGGYHVPTDDVIASAGSAIELVNFDVIDGANASDVIKADVATDTGFLRAQPGYQSRIGAMGKNELTQSTAHIAVVYWKSLDQAVAAANALFAAQAALTPQQRAAMPNYQKPGTPYFYSHYFDKLAVAKP